MKKVKSLVKIKKAGKYKIVPENHPDAKRHRKISIKNSYKNKKRAKIRAKQYWNKMPIVYLTEYDFFNKNVCLKCSCENTIYCNNCRFNNIDETKNFEDLTKVW